MKKSTDNKSIWSVAEILKPTVVKQQQAVNQMKPDVDDCISAILLRLQRNYRHKLGPKWMHLIPAQKSNLINIVSHWHLVMSIWVALKLRENSSMNHGKEVMQQSIWGSRCNHQSIIWANWCHHQSIRSIEKRNLTTNLEELSWLTNLEELNWLATSRNWRS